MTDKIKIEHMKFTLFIPVYYMASDTDVESLYEELSKFKKDRKKLISVKKIKTEPLIGNVDNTFIELWNEFLEIRKRKHKSKAPTVLKIIIKDLLDLSQNKKLIAIQSLQQSIVKNYDSLYLPFQKDTEKQTKLIDNNPKIKHFKGTFNQFIKNKFKSR